MIRGPMRRCGWRNPSCSCLPIGRSGYAKALRLAQRALALSAAVEAEIK